MLISLYVLCPISLKSSSLSRSSSASKYSNNDRDNGDDIKYLLNPVK